MVTYYTEIVISTIRNIRNLPGAQRQHVTPSCSYVPSGQSCLLKRNKLRLRLELSSALSVTDITTHWKVPVMGQQSGERFTKLAKRNRRDSR